MKKVILMLCLSCGCISIFADEKDIEKEIRTFLHSKDVHLAIVSLIKLPEKPRDAYNALYSYSFLKKKIRSKEYRSSLTNPEYEQILARLVNIAYLVYQGRKTPLDLKNMRPLLEMISQSDVRPIKMSDSVVPAWSSNVVARGLLIVLYKGDKPAYAFDIITPEKLLMPLFYQDRPGRLYKFHLDDKNRLYMFDSYFYSYNEEVNRLSAALWRKLDVVVRPVAERDRKRIPRQFYNDYGYVPRVAAKGLKVYEVDDFVSAYYQEAIRAQKKYAQRFLTQLGALDKKLKKKPNDKHLEEEVADVKNSLSYPTKAINELRKAFKKAKDEINKRKKSNHTK